MKIDHLKALRCPMCKGYSIVTTVEENKENEIWKGKIHCQTCDIDYPIENGIPNFISLSLINDLIDDLI